MKSNTLGLPVLALLLGLMAAPAQANGVSLDFASFEIYTVAGYNTTATDRYALGVSSTPGGALINGPPLALATGNVYYLYAGNLAQFQSNLAPGATTILKIFSNYVNAASNNYTRTYSVVGSPGVFGLWNPVDVYNNGLDPIDIYLGWAQGTADKVDLNSFSPGGGNDIYLVLGIGVQPTNAGGGGVVPLPAAAWLLLSGLAGLGAMVRRKTH